MITFLFYFDAIFQSPKGVKVLAIASMLRALLVKNLPAKINSVFACSSLMRKFIPSHSKRVSLFQVFMSSSTLIYYLFPKILEEKTNKTSR